MDGCLIGSQWPSRTEDSSVVPGHDCSLIITVAATRLVERGLLVVRAHPITSVANRFWVLLVKRGIFASYGQRYGKTRHPTNVANQVCEPGHWWARYKSNRITFRWFAGGSHISIGRPHHCSLGWRLCIFQRFANRICLQLCLNGGQTPKSGRSQTNTRCVEDRTGVSRSEIHEHAVTSGHRFRARRRRRSLSGHVGGGGGGTPLLLVDIRRHARFWVGLSTSERCD